MKKQPKKRKPWWLTEIEKMRPCDGGLNALMMRVDLDPMRIIQTTSNSDLSWIFRKLVPNADGLFHAMRAPERDTLDPTSSDHSCQRKSGTGAASGSLA